jgi:hypothetical protein
VCDAVRNRHQRNGKCSRAGPSVATSLYVETSLFTTVPGALSSSNTGFRALENGFSFSPDKTQCVHFTHLRGLRPHPSLLLSNCALPFVITVKFLGLMLDSKLSWEPHLRWLCVRREWSLNVLKVLSGGSWDGDRKVMLRLYRSLVRSKVDYGSFVYGSTTKSKLSMMDPIHNIGIHLATGTFHTSSLKSLYAESGEPPLDLWRNILLCGCVAKLATQPTSHLTWCSFPSHTPHQVQFKHNSFPTCGRVLPPAYAMT